MGEIPKLTLKSTGSQNILAEYPHCKDSQNNLLNKCKIPRIPPLLIGKIPRIPPLLIGEIPRIPPLLIGEKFITNCKDKAEHFNKFFVAQCKPLQNTSSLPPLIHITNTKLGTFDIGHETIINLVKGYNVNKTHGSDNISIQMIQLCGHSICRPLRIIFNNIISTGIFPELWKLENITPCKKG